MIAVILTAAGEGSRFNPNKQAPPKQYLPFRCGRSAFEICLEKFAAIPKITEFVAVINPAHDVFYAPILSRFHARFEKSVTIAFGAESRATSVQAGVKALSETAETVLIHDAARPGFSDRLIDNLITALQSNDAATPAQAVTDSVHYGATGKLTTAASRTGLFTVQTPQAFDLKTLKSVYAAFPEAQESDEVSFFLQAGKPVTIVSAEAGNFKITQKTDFEAMQNRLDEENGVNFPDIRTGFGYDVHQLIPAPDGKIILGGVIIPHDMKLKGVSDADVILHALTDAILGAAGAEDIGFHFPPNDPQWRGADSAQFLRHAVKLASERGGKLNHVDVTLIGEKPKLSPYREAIRDNIAGICDLPPQKVSVKATTTEKLGFTGRGEGLAAQAVATLIFTQPKK